MLKKRTIVYNHIKSNIKRRNIYIYMEKRILNAAKRSIYYRSARSIRISEFNALRINIATCKQTKDS